jgi:hypothetical protein
MAETGGQPGNQNAAKGARWREAIMRALARRKGTVDQGLDAAADKLVALVERGDKWALDHLAERMDGKAPQGITLSGDAENPLQTKSVIEFVNGSDPAPEET